jgi:hypothetical protein
MRVIGKDEKRKATYEEWKINFKNINVRDKSKKNEGSI